MTEHDDAGDVRREREVRLLWAAILAGPLAWILGFGADYALVRVACTGGTTLPLHVVTLATGLLAASGGWLALGAWRRAGPGDPLEDGARSTPRRFMAALGLLTSGLFLFVIFAQWLPKLFLHPCMGV